MLNFCPDWSLYGSFWRSFGNLESSFDCRRRSCETHSTPCAHAGRSCKRGKAWVISSSGFDPGSQTLSSSGFEVDDEVLRMRARELKVHSNSITGLKLAYPLTMLMYISSRPVESRQKCRRSSDGVKRAFATYSIYIVYLDSRVLIFLHSTGVVACVHVSARELSLSLRPYGCTYM